MDSKSTSNQASSNTNSCKMGCGFYGSSSFEGYCSKCYQGVVDSRVEKQCPNGVGASGSAAAAAARAGSPIVASDGQTPFNKNGIPVPSRSQSSLTNISRRASDHDQQATMDIDEDSFGSASANGDAASSAVDGNQSRNVDQASSGSKAESDKSASSNLAANDPVLLLPGTTTAPAAADNNSSLAADNTALNLSVASTGSSAEDGEKSSKKRRCAACRKKVGLTGFECRCGGLFCTEHRYADSHACEFDYKSMEREGIRKANPVVAAEKVRKF